MQQSTTMTPTPANIRRLYSLKDKLSILLEWETGALNCKAVARKYRVQPCQLREWKKKREGDLREGSSNQGHYIKASIPFEDVYP
jgi:transposase-like protein